jgi:alpha-beta hydrolase superfamily lysophospholipase
MNETDTINIQDFRSMDTIRRGIVLYFHGNRKNISWYAKYADGFTRNGYELLMMDYPGYGKSRGKITEQKLYNWALQVYKLALSRYAADSIIIYGKSLGTCIASQLAASRDCKRLILETPYYSMSRLTRNYLPIFPVNWLLRYEMPTWRYLQQVSAPISIFHGTKDRVISLKHSLLLKSFLKPGDELITANGAKHNGLFDYAEARYKLDSILRLR